MTTIRAMISPELVCELRWELFARGVIQGEGAPELCHRIVAVRLQWDHGYAASTTPPSTATTRIRACLRRDHRDSSWATVRRQETRHLSGRCRRCRMPSPERVGGAGRIGSSSDLSESHDARRKYGR